MTRALSLEDLSGKKTLEGWEVGGHEEDTGRLLKQ